MLSLLRHLHINVLVAFLLDFAQVLLLKAVITLGAVWPKTYFLFLFPSSFSETRIRSFDREIKYCISVSISLSLSLSKTGILLRLPWNLGSDGFLINPFSHSSDKYPDRFGAIFFASLSPMGWQTTQVPFKTSSFPLSSLSVIKKQKRLLQTCRGIYLKNG